MHSLPTFKREEWFNMGKWAQPTLPGVFWCYWNDTESVRASSRGCTFDHLIILDGNFPTKKSDKEKLHRIVEEVLTRGEARAYGELLERVGARAEQEHLSILKTKSDQPREYLPDLFRTYLEVVGFWTFVLLMGDVLNDYFLTKKLAASPEEMIERLSAMMRPTWLEEQSREVREITRSILEKGGSGPIDENALSWFPEISNTIDRHVEKFRWFGTHHWLGVGYDRKQCLSQIRDVAAKHLPPKSTGLTQETADNPTWSLLATVAYWRTHCAELTSKVVFESRPHLLRIASDWRLAYEQLVYLSRQEILERLRLGTAQPLPENFEARKHAYGCFIDGEGNARIVTGADLKALMGQLLRAPARDVQELRGVVASRSGIVTGRANLLVDPRDFAKFESGDILVAPETTPDFVPYMKMAKAIVTDRGGITSHASIVSRELGKPCVIGTEYATQVLQDGDTIEVDTERGIVRKLS